MPVTSPCRLAVPWLLALSVTEACASARQVSVRSASAGPRTQAERSGYTETSTHAQVLAFIDSLTRLGQPIATGSVGTTREGRSIPYVIASRPLFATPAAAHRSGRPVVYVQGNIHAGEVEGKEALQALLRDLLLEARPNVLDSIVLIAVPIYNGDGNERFDHQARNRGAQNGPEMVGQRPNAQGFDLNRDYIKAEAPETRASLAMFNQWDPHVFVDLHTTDGSYHGYNLTWAPSLNPAAALPAATIGGAWARDTLLPEVQRRTLARHGVKIFPYGNFAQDEGGPAGAPKDWLSYDSRPRFGTNYYALRGRISILSEAYSHDSFEVRVHATYVFVRELLSLVAERQARVLSIATTSDAALTAPEPLPWSVPVRAELTKSPRTADVIYEELERTTDTTRTEPGVRRGYRRTGRMRTEALPVHDRFDPTLLRPVPWGYAVAPADTGTLRVLQLHGIRLDTLAAPWTGDAGPQFVVDSASVAARPFQGRREVRLAGRWVTDRPVTLVAGTIIARTRQPLGVLLVYLLEPESDDGVVAWDLAGHAAGATTPAPVVRLSRAPSR